MLTHRQLFWGVVVLSGCVAAKQYTLEIDATDPGATRLCAVQSGETRKNAPCPQFANDTLDSPGTLNVVVTHAADTDTYRLRLQQTSLGATGQDAATIVATVLQRLAGFADSYMNSASLPDPGADATKRKAALTEFGQQLLAAGKEELATVAKREAEKIVGTLPSTTARFDASQLGYGAFLDKNHPDQPPHALSPNPGEPGLLHQRNVPYPPPRLVKLAKQDLIALATETPPHKGADPELWLALLTQATCSLASFGDAPYRDAKLSLPEYFKNNTPTQQAMAVALQIEHTSIDDLLKTEGDIRRTTLIARLQDLRQSARKKIAAHLNGQSTDPLRSDEELVVALYDGDRAYRDATSCIVNVDYIASLAGQKPADADLAKVAAALGAERAALIEFQQSTAKYHDLFYNVIDAVVARVVVSLTLGVYSGGGVHFSSISLQPGQLQVGVTRAQGSETPASVVDYTINVETNPRYAVSIGPVLSFCRSCYRHITEQIESDAMMGKRELVLATEQSDYATGVLLHVALVNRGSLSIGPALGYPISDAQNRAQAVLLGLSVRHRVGVALAAGVALFNGVHLKPAYGGRDAQSGTAINTNLPGFTGLTAESVVDQGHEAAFFISVGVTSDLFQRLN